MNRFKRVLAFALVLVMVLGGIEPFSLRAYADGLDDAVTVTEPGGADTEKPFVIEAGQPSSDGPEAQEAGSTDQEIGGVSQDSDITDILPDASDEIESDDPVEIGFGDIAETTSAPTALDGATGNTAMITVKTSGPVGLAEVRINKSDEACAFNIDSTGALIDVSGTEACEMKTEDGLPIPAGGDAEEYSDIAWKLDDPEYAVTSITVKRDSQNLTLQTDAFKDADGWYHARNGLAEDSKGYEVEYNGKFEPYIDYYKGFKVKEALKLQAGDTVTFNVARIAVVVNLNGHSEMGKYAYKSFFASSLADAKARTESEYDALDPSSKKMVLENGIEWLVCQDITLNAATDLPREDIAAALDVYAGNNTVTVGAGKSVRFCGVLTADKLVLNANSKLTIYRTSLDGKVVGGILSAEEVSGNGTLVMEGSKEASTGLRIYDANIGSLDGASLSVGKLCVVQLGTASIKNLTMERNATLRVGGSDSSAFNVTGLATIYGESIIYIQDGVSADIASVKFVKVDGYKNGKYYAKNPVWICRSQIAGDKLKIGTVTGDKYSSATDTGVYFEFRYLSNINNFNTVQPYPKEATVAMVKDDNPDLYRVPADSTGTEYALAFSKGDVYVPLVIADLSVWVGEKKEGVFPEWGDASLVKTPVSGRNLKSAFDSILADKAQYAGKKIYVPITSNTSVKNLKLPVEDDCIEVEFVSVNGSRLTLEIDDIDEDYKDSNYTLNGVDLFFVNSDADYEPGEDDAPCLAADLTLKNGASVDAEETIALTGLLKVYPALAGREASAVYKYLSAKTVEIEAGATLKAQESISVENLILDENAILAGYDHINNVVTIKEASVRQALMMEKGSLIEAGRVSVRGLTTLSAGSKIYICSDNENGIVNTYFMGGIRLDGLYYGEKAYICKAFKAQRVIVVDDIERTFSGQLALTYRPLDSDKDVSFDSGEVVLTVYSTSDIYSNLTANTGNRYSVPFEGSERTASFAATNETTNLSGVHYSHACDLTVSGIQVYVCEKNDDIKDRRPFGYVSTYDEAIDLINANGNINQKYYVILDEDCTLPGAFRTPAATAAAEFAIMGSVSSSGERKQLVFANDVNLTVPLTLTNIELISREPGDPKIKSQINYKAYIKTNGKALSLVNSTMSVEPKGSSKPFESLAGNGDLFLDGASSLEISGAVSVNNLKLSGGSRLFGMTANSTVSGDACITGNSAVEMAANTLTVSKNLYMNASSMGLTAGNDANAAADPMYAIILQHKLFTNAPVNIIVKGDSYLRKATVFASGNITLATVYSDRQNRVLYGFDVKNTFTVKNVIPTVNLKLATDGVGVAEDPFSWASKENWITDLSSASPAYHFYEETGLLVKGSNEGLNYSKAVKSTSAISVRRAAIEQGCYGGVDASIFRYSLTEKWSVDSSDEEFFISSLLATAYGNNKMINIVNTTAGAEMFVVGRGSYAEGAAGYNKAVYDVRSTGKAIVIDDTESGNVTLYIVESDGITLRAVGNFATPEEAFARINAIKNTKADYYIEINADYPVADKNRNPANMALPTQAASVTIDLKGHEIIFKDEIKISVNTTFKNAKFVSKSSSQKVTLNNAKLTFDDCSLTRLTIASVTGSGVLKDSAFIVKNSEDQNDRFGKTVTVSGAISNVGTLGLTNVAIFAYGKVNVGTIDASVYTTEELIPIYRDAEGNYLGSDDTKVTDGKYDTGIGLKSIDYTKSTYIRHTLSLTDEDDNPVEEQHAKLIVTADVTGTKISNDKDGKDTSTIKITPNLTVAGEIVSRSSTVDWVMYENSEGGFEWLWDDACSQYFSIGLAVKDKDGNYVHVDKYFEDLYTGFDNTSRLDALKLAGIPFAIAPKAAAGEVDFDANVITNVYTRKSGKIIKSVVGNNVCLAFSESQEFVPYTLRANGEKIADFMTWADVVKAIDTMAVKREYEVLLNYDFSKSEDRIKLQVAEKWDELSASFACNTPATAEALVMPNAKNISRLTIMPANRDNLIVHGYDAHEKGYRTADWYYTGDKIAFPCDVELSSLNLVAVKNGEIISGGSDFLAPLTVTTSGDIKIAGNLAFGGRSVILDGSKKGTLTFYGLTSKVKDEEGKTNSVIYTTLNEIPSTATGHGGISGSIKNFKKISNDIPGKEWKLALYPYYANVKDYKAGKETLSEFSVTELELTDNQMVYAANVTITDLTLNGYAEVYAQNKATVTNLVMEGAGPGVDQARFVSEGPATVTNATLKDHSFVSIDPYSDKTTALNITNLTVDAEDTVTVNASSYSTVTIGKITVSDGKLFLRYPQNKLNITGAVTGEKGSIRIDAYDESTDEPLADMLYDGSEEDKYAFVTAKSASADMFVPVNDSDKSFAYNPEYTGALNKGQLVFFYKSGNVIYGTQASNIRAEVRKDAKNGELLGSYLSYADAVNAINDKNKDFFILVNDFTSSSEKPVKLTAPAKAKAKSVTITPAGKDTVSLYYNAAPVLANDVTIDNIALCSVDAKGDRKGYMITLSGAYKLSMNDCILFDNDEITGLTATTGEIEMIRMGNVPVGSVNVKNLMLVDTLLDVPESRNTIKVTGTLSLSADAILSAWQGVSVTINDLVSDSSDNVISTIPDVSVAKDGFVTLKPMLTINGKVTGNTQINIWMNDKADDDDAYKLNVKDLPKYASKKLFVAKNAESSQIKTFFDAYELGDNAVKAEGAFIYTDDEEVLKKTVVFKIGDEDNESRYLDFDQAVKHINELNDPAGRYTIFLSDDITDTIVTDAISHSKLNLPADNKAESLTLKPVASDVSRKLYYSEADAVTVYGVVNFSGVIPVPVDSKKADPETTAVPKSKITLKVNSAKDALKESKLTIKSADASLKNIYLASLQGVKGVSELELNRVRLFAGTSIDSVGKISFLGNSSDKDTVMTAKATNIGTVDGGAYGSYFIVTGTASVDDIAGNVSLLTAYSENKGVKTSLFTLNNSADLTGTKVRVLTIPTIDPATKKAVAITTAIVNPENWFAPYLFSIYNTNSVPEVTKKMLGIPLLIAKKSGTKNIEINGLSTTEDGYTDIIYYKSAKNEVIADHLSEMEVRIYTDNGSDTYTKTWADAVAVVDAVASKGDFFYMVALKEEINADKSGKGTGAIYLPKAGPTVSLVSSTPEIAKLCYTGAFNSTCDVEVNGVCLQEMYKGSPRKEYESTINITNPVKVTFYSLCRNWVKTGDGGSLGNEPNIKLASLTVKKGTLRSIGSTIEVEGAVNVDNLDVSSYLKVQMKPDSNGIVQKQTYGRITGSGMLMLDNYFTKAVPTASTGQLTITGQVDPRLNMQVYLYNALYKETKPGKYEVRNGYEAMSSDYVKKFLLHTDASKAPAARTSVLNAPYLTSCNTLFIANGSPSNAYSMNYGTVTKVIGALYITDQSQKIHPVARLTIEERADMYNVTSTELFTRWDDVIAEINSLSKVKDKAATRYTISLLNGLCDPVMYDRGEFTDEKGYDSSKYIKSIPIAQLTLPANVDSLEIVSEGTYELNFVNPAVTVNTNLTLDCVELVAYKAVKKTVYVDNKGKQVKKTVTVYEPTTPNINVAAGKKLTVKLPNLTHPMAFGNITGTATSELEISAGTANAKVSANAIKTFKTVTVNKPGLVDVAGELSCKDLFVEGTTNYDASIVASIIYVSGATTFSGLAPITLAAKHGVGILKINDISMKMRKDVDIDLIAKVTGNGLPQLTITGAVTRDETYYNGFIKLGVMYKTADSGKESFVNFYNGQFAAYITNETAFNEIEGLKSAMSPSDGHTLPVTYELTYDASKRAAVVGYNN